MAKEFVSQKLVDPKAILAPIKGNK